MIFINYILVIKLLSDYEEKVFYIIPPDLRTKLLTETNIKLLNSLTKTNYSDTKLGLHPWNTPSCVANMKTIEGAVELYQMENGTNNNIQIEDLADNGYLKKTPKCPKNTSKLNILKYIIKTKLINNKIVTDVECPFDGVLSNQEK